MSARSMLTGLLLILINTYSGQSRRCQNQDTSVPCPTVKQINSTECHSAGCCWDANNTACYQDNVYNSTTSQPTRIPSITLTSATQKSGYCIQYNRPACRALLNDSETQNTTRFIDSRYGIGRTEQLLSVFLGVIEKQVKEKEHDCKRLLKVIVCQFVLPRCDAHNVPKNYCREDCDAIFDKCNLELSQLLAVIQYVVDQTNIELVHLAIPNCTQFRYSYESDDTCDHFGLFDFQASSSSPPAKNSYALVIGASVGVSLLVAFIVIIAIFVRRSFLKKQCDYKGVTFTAVTMRDRLRADTIMALDEMKVMSLYNPDDLIQYPLDKVEYVKDLGEGNFGQVFQGRVFGLRPLDKPETELMVAVKTLKSGCSKEMKVAFLKEVTMMSVLHHENIVELLAVSTEEEPYGMIFEFMANGDLNQYLRTKGPYALEDQESTKENIPSKEDLLSMSLQVANGMEYLQTMRLVHRDLATRNCLVGDGLTIKIADFGMSRDVYASDYYKVEGQAVMPIRWMPPEALLFGKFTVESDVYSYGVLLWEIYTFALQPYYGYTNEEVVDFVKKGVHLGKPDDCEDYIYDVMKYCWNKDPSQRPNFQKIKALLKQEDESAYDLPDEPAATLANPIYQEKLDLQQVVQPVKSSPVLRQNNSSTGYMNVGYKETADQDNSTRKFEEGELEV